MRIEILPGIEDNQLIKITGAGEAGERGTGVGDLYVRVRVRPHAKFERHGADLVVAQELNVIDLLLGKKIEVPTIAGGKTSIEVPAGFNLKENLRSYTGCRYAEIQFVRPRRPACQFYRESAQEVGRQSAESSRRGNLILSLSAFVYRGDLAGRKRSIIDADVVDKARPITWFRRMSFRGTYTKNSLVQNYWYSGR